MSSKAALVIEDTDANRIFFERLLTQAGFQVRGARSAAEAFCEANMVEDLALAVIDMEVGDMNGLDMTTKLRHRYPNSCLVVATMHDEVSLMASAFSRGCDVFMVKPHGFMELFKRLTTTGTVGLHAARPLIIDQFGPREFKLAY
jgi:DNA-binding response OmpR family regulator